MELLNANQFVALMFPFRNEEIIENKINCIILVCVWKNLASQTQTSCTIWKKDVGAVLGIYARPTRDLDYLYKVLQGSFLHGRREIHVWPISGK